MIESAPDAIVIIDADGEIQLVNAQTETLFGYTREELIGQTNEVLVPELLRDRHREHRATYTESPRARPMGDGLELLRPPQRRQRVPGRDLTQPTPRRERDADLQHDP